MNIDVCDHCGEPAERYIKDEMNSCFLGEGHWALCEECWSEFLGFVNQNNNE